MLQHMRETCQSAARLPTTPVTWAQKKKWHPSLLCSKHHKLHANMMNLTGQSIENGFFFLCPSTENNYVFRCSIQGGSAFSAGCYASQEMQHEQRQGYCCRPYLYPVFIPVLQVRINIRLLKHFKRYIIWHISQNRSPASQEGLLKYPQMLSGKPQFTCEDMNELWFKRAHNIAKSLVLQ